MREVPAVTTAAATAPNAEGNAIKLSLNDHANPESATNAVQTAGAVNTKASEVVTASAEVPTTKPDTDRFATQSWTGQGFEGGRK